MRALLVVSIIAAFLASHGCERNPGSPATVADQAGANDPTPSPQARAEQTAPEQQPAAADTPLALAERYTILLAEGRAAEALEQYVDFHAIAERIHAAANVTATPEELAEAAEALRDMMLAPYADPTMADVMKSARYSGLDVMPADNGITVVAYTVSYLPPDGPRMANAVYIAPVADGALKIVDVDTGRGASIVAMFGSTPEVTGQRPIDFIRDMRAMALKRLKDAGGSLPAAGTQGR